MIYNNKSYNTCVSTGVSLEDTATSSKKIPAREVSRQGGLNRHTAYKFHCCGLSKSVVGWEARAMPSQEWPAQQDVWMDPEG